jgi:hypothetical protein
MPSNKFPGIRFGYAVSPLLKLHVSHLTLSDTPKILLYCTEYRRPLTLAPTNEESSAQ